MTTHRAQSFARMDYEVLREAFYKCPSPEFRDAVIALRHMWKDRHLSQIRDPTERQEIIDIHDANIRAIRKAWKDARLACGRSPNGREGRTP